MGGCMVMMDRLGCRNLHIWCGAGGRSVLRARDGWMVGWLGRRHQNITCDLSWLREDESLRPWRQAFLSTLSSQRCKFVS